MKFKHRDEGDTTFVSLLGLIDVEGCTCLENFFDARVAGCAHLDLDLAQADLSAPGAMRVLSDLVVRSVRAGTRVAVRKAPPELATELASRGIGPGDGLSVNLEPSDDP